MSRLSDWLKAHPAPKAQAKPWGIELSYSQIRAYLDCPWRYKLRYIDFLRSAPTAPGSLGNSVHKALERFHREKNSGRDRLFELYEECWRSEGYSTPQEQMQWHAKGLEILEAYWKAESASGADILCVEREFLFPVGSHQVRGMIDRIDRLPGGGCEVIDYKTHTDFETEASVKDDLQLRMYALAAREALALKPERLTIYYVAAGKKVSAPYDASGEPELLEFLSRMGDLLSAAGDFAPDHAFCPRCDLRNRCGRSAAKDPDCV